MLKSNQASMKYIAQTFTFPNLTGISATTMAEHLKLYEGYVKHANLITDELAARNPETDGYAIAEMQRRFSFEFDGMRNHEVYFSLLSGGATPRTPNSSLEQAIAATWGSVETWMSRFKTMAKTRGIGWAILYYDPHTTSLVETWVDEQHLGHLVGCIPIIALDMWEHSFVADYQPSGKAQYIEDFFANLNWSVAEARYEQAARV